MLEDCVLEITRVLLESGEKPTATKLLLALGKTAPLEKFKALPDPIVFKIEDSEEEKNLCQYLL